jgi:hypothetical protein
VRSTSNLTTGICAVSLHLLTLRYRILDVYFSAFLFFRLSIPTGYQLGNSTQTNIDGARIQALLLLMQCFTSARRYGLGCGSRALKGGPLIFLAGIATLFDSLWDEKQKGRAGKVARLIIFIFFWKSLRIMGLDAC